MPLVRALGEIPGIEDMSLTTNATLLASIAKELYEAGIHRINISLDTLDAENTQRSRAEESFQTHLTAYARHSRPG